MFLVQIQPHTNRWNIGGREPLCGQSGAERPLQGRGKEKQLSAGTNSDSWRCVWPEFMPFTLGVIWLAFEGRSWGASLAILEMEKASHRELPQ